MKTSLGYIGADSFSRQRKEQRADRDAAARRGGNSAARAAVAAAGR